jgi:hypothetical protein
MIVAFSYYRPPAVNVFTQCERCNPQAKRVWKRRNLPQSRGYRKKKEKLRARMSWKFDTLRGKSPYEKGLTVKALARRRIKITHA